MKISLSSILIILLFSSCEIQQQEHVTPLPKDDESTAKTPTKPSKVIQDTKKVIRYNSPQKISPKQDIDKSFENISGEIIRGKAIHPFPKENLLN